MQPVGVAASSINDAKPSVYCLAAARGGVIGDHLAEDRNGEAEWRCEPIIATRRESLSEQRPELIFPQIACLDELPTTILIDGSVVSKSLMVLFRRSISRPI
ncbi:hypothetical protein J6590_029891 [Homalodisca vitripennis]|nr:hypothetical protein J6590_029891 [Homalodisca vitripennis]